MISSVPQIDLTTEFGTFRTLYHESSGGNAISLSTGKVDSGVPLIRLQSSCVFSESFHSNTCDCAFQLQASLKAIADHGSGVLVYQYDEGRGAGLGVKFRAMSLEAQENINSAEAYQRLGLAPDMRNYATAITILRHLGVASTVALITNNPAKREALERSGFFIVKVVTLRIPTSDAISAYLRMKRECLGHTYLPAD